MERHAYVDHVNMFSITRASYVCVRVSREKINHIFEKFLNFSRIYREIWNNIFSLFLSFLSENNREVYL